MFSNMINILIYFGEMFRLTLSDPLVSTSIRRYTIISQLQTLVLTAKRYIRLFLGNSNNLTANMLFSVSYLSNESCWNLRNSNLVMCSLLTLILWYLRTYISLKPFEVKKAEKKVSKIYSSFLDITQFTSRWGSFYSFCLMRYVGKI